MALPKLNVPQYSIKLPSTGEHVNMRPYLVKEEKVLMIALESNDIEQITEAVRNVILSCYDIQGLDDLTVFDIEYMFLQLRGKSVGEKMQIQVKCPNGEGEENCGALTPIIVDVNEIEIINADLDRTIMLDEQSGVGIRMRFPSMELIGQLDPEKLTSIDGVMDLIVSCVDQIFDEDNVYDAKEQTKEEISEFIESLSGEQFKLVQAFFENVPAVYYKTTYDCTKCGNNNVFEVKGLNNFFT